MQHRISDTGQGFETSVCTATENSAAYSSPSLVLGITRPQSHLLASQAKSFSLVRFVLLEQQADVIHCAATEFQW